MQKSARRLAEEPVDVRNVLRPTPIEAHQFRKREVVDYFSVGSYAEFFDEWKKLSC